MSLECGFSLFFFFQAEDGIRDLTVTGVQTCALPISTANTLVVMSISPLLTVLLARLVLSDPVRMRTWLAAAAAGAGIAWMFGAGFSGQDARHLSGMLVALAIPFASAINVVTLRAAAGRLDLVPALVLGGAMSCAISLPFALPFSAAPRDLALLAFLGFFQLGLPCSAQHEPLRSRNRQRLPPLRGMARGDQLEALHPAFGPAADHRRDSVGASALHSSDSEGFTSRRALGRRRHHGRPERRSDQAQTPGRRRLARRRDQTRNHR